jgi:hypothetical protein
MSKAKRWTAECDDAAILARAILNGTVDNTLQSFKDFFDPESAGPGAAIGKKYNYHTVKGQRNLKLNWLKLVKKNSVWKTNQPDPDTGKGKCCYPNNIHLI